MSRFSSYHGRFMIPPHVDDICFSRKDQEELGHEAQRQGRGVLRILDGAQLL